MLLFVCLCLCSRASLSLRVVDLVEHELARDGRLGSIYGGGTALERRNHLLHHLVEEDVSELGVEEGAKFEGDSKIHSAGPRVPREAGAETPHRLQVVEQFTI